MANGASAEATNESVRAIMMEISLKNLIGHPNTENVDHLEEQMEKNCFSVRTTAWGGCHGCLTLTLSNTALSTATKVTVPDIVLRKPDKINAAIREDSSYFYQLTLKADQDTL